jgi:hypothetical protein
MAEKAAILGFLGVFRAFPKPDLKELGTLDSPRYEVVMGELATFWDGKGAGQGHHREVQEPECHGEADHVKK